MFTEKKHHTFQMSQYIYLLQAVTFLDLLAVGLIIPLIPNHVRQMGANHIYIGLLGSIYAGFQLGSGPLVGSLSDINGRKKILIFTLLVSGAAYTMLGFTTSVAVVLFVRAVLGLFKQTQMLGRALVPDYEKNEQTQSEIYGKMAAISGIGITLGPIIGGHVVEDYPNYGFRLIAVLVGICFTFNAALVSLLPNIKTKTRNKRSQNSVLVWSSVTKSVSQPFTELLKVKWSLYWDIFVLKALIGFAMGVYYSNYVLYLKTQFDLSPKYVGYVISFQGTIGSITSFLIGFINSFYNNDDDYSVRNFHVFILLFASLLGLILSANVYVYTFWLVPLAIANAVGRLVTLEMILRRSHGNHRGSLIGASNSVRSLSGVVAPMVAGVIGQFVGITYVIYASLLSVSIGLLVSYRNREKSIKVD